MARSWCKTPKTFFLYIYVKHLILIRVRTADPRVTLYSSLCIIKGIYANLKIKKSDQFLERLIPLCRFFLAPHFSGWIPIWSVGARHVYLLALAFKFHARRSPRRGTFRYSSGTSGPTYMVQTPCLGVLLVSHVNQVIQPLFLH